MTVDKWLNYWSDSIICDLAPTTIRNYRERYEKNIQPLIGTMCIAEVKTMHCKAVLNQMEIEYAGSTIRQTYISMGTMFKSAFWKKRNLTVNKSLEYRHIRRYWRAGSPTTKKVTVLFRLQNVHIQS